MKKTPTDPAPPSAEGDASTPTNESKEEDSELSWQEKVGHMLLEGFKRMDNDPAFREEISKITK